MADKIFPTATAVSAEAKIDDALANAVTADLTGYAKKTEVTAAIDFNSLTADQVTALKAKLA